MRAASGQSPSMATKENPFVLDQFARDLFAHAIELRCAVRRLAEQNHTRIADPSQHRPEIRRIDRRELFAGSCERLSQRAVAGFRGASSLRSPAFGPHQWNEANIREFFGRVFPLAHADDAHQFLQASIRPDRE